MTFATNDERTAKRISETLGTATELRAQRCYAGHRLAPWLGHLMVSRQRRPAAADAGRGDAASAGRCRSDGVQHGADQGPEAALRRRHFSSVLPPPELADGRYADAPPLRPDDWSGLAIPAVPAAPAVMPPRLPGVGRRRRPRRQPELTEAVAYDPSWPRPTSACSMTTTTCRFLASDPAMQRTARLASSTPTTESSYEPLSPEPLYPAEHAQRLDELPPRKACPSQHRRRCLGVLAVAGRPTSARRPSPRLDRLSRPSEWSATRASPSRRWRCSSATT